MNYKKQRQNQKPLSFNTSFALDYIINYYETATNKPSLKYEKNNNLKPNNNKATITRRKKIKK